MLKSPMLLSRMSANDTMLRWEVPGIRGGREGGSEGGAKGGKGSEGGNTGEHAQQEPRLLHDDPCAVVKATLPAHAQRVRSMLVAESPDAENMPPMAVMLDVLKLSSWSNATAPCRVKTANGDIEHHR